jgi:1-deoxy-D-xylulose-5-phosphate reductoisomerase
MKKKIGILGSTGSIGSNLLRIIDKKNTEVVFLLASKNYKKILNQAKKFNVKNIIITDNKSFENAIKNNKNKSFNIFNSNYDLEKIIKKKLDYVMSSITGIEGLKPTFDIIKYTKKIAIANKETLICAWSIIEKELKKNKTQFVPVDSEHFSIWSEIKNINVDQIKRVYLTASGGPLLKFKNIPKHVSFKKILNHPTWKMGKKISIKL